MINPKRISGFTLIELMIVVAIIAILAAVAYPSYTESVKKSRRSDARAALSGAAQNLERYFTQQWTYVSGTLPTTSEHGYYTLSYATGQPTASTFTIQATPVGGQASDKCKTFTLDQAGNQSVIGGATLTAAECWNNN